MLASENKQISGLLQQLSNLGAVGSEIAAQSGQNAVVDAHDLLPVVQQLDAVSSQLAPDLSALASFEAETPKIAPGDYLQVNANHQRGSPLRGVRAYPSELRAFGPRLGTDGFGIPTDGGETSSIRSSRRKYLVIQR